MGEGKAGKFSFASGERKPRGSSFSKKEKEILLPSHFITESFCGGEAF